MKPYSVSCNNLYGKQSEAVYLKTCINESSLGSSLNLQFSIKFLESLNSRSLANPGFIAVLSTGSSVLIPSHLDLELYIF